MDYKTIEIYYESEGLTELVFGPMREAILCGEKPLMTFLFSDRFNTDFLIR